MCIGAMFSSHVLRIVLATILQRFHPVLPPAIRIDHQVRAANLGTKAPIPLHLENRHNPRPKPTGVRGTIRDLVEFPTLA
jgi:cytochrome P450